MSNKHLTRLRNVAKSSPKKDCEKKFGVLLLLCRKPGYNAVGLMSGQCIHNLGLSSASPPCQCIRNQDLNKLRNAESIPVRSNDFFAAVPTSLLDVQWCQTCRTTTCSRNVYAKNKLTNENSSMQRGRDSPVYAI